ncbi:MAG TPA: peroxiredoxin [Gemmatimonadales bacterium]
MYRYTFPMAGLLLAAPLGSLAAQSAGGNPRVVLAATPREGTMAPGFSLQWATKDTIGTPDAPYELWRDRGKTVVLAFYPADFTKGCTAELQTFADQYDTLFGEDVVVLGISSDSLASHKRFAASLDLPFRLLSDPDLTVARKYASHGDGGRAKRTVFVVGPDGKIRYQNLKFNPLDPKDYSALGSAVRAARGD